MIKIIFLAIFTYQNYINLYTAFTFTSFYKIFQSINFFSLFISLCFSIYLFFYCTVKLQNTTILLWKIYNTRDVLKKCNPHLAKNLFTLNINFFIKFSPLISFEFLLKSTVFRFLHVKIRKQKFINKSNIYCWKIWVLILFDNIIINKKYIFIYINYIIIKLIFISKNNKVNIICYKTIKLIKLLLSAETTLDHHLL